MAAALVTGSIVRISTLRGEAPEVATARLRSLRSWWMVAIVVAGVALGGLAAASVVFGVVSALALVEFFRLAEPTTSALTKCLTYCLVPVAYLFIGWGPPLAFQIIFPVAAMGLLSIVLICEQRTSGFLRDVSVHVWGLLLTTYLLGYTVLLFRLPVGDELNTGAWFLLLVVLTESNDIMQALVGRKWGRTKLSPLVSPHKSWEGLLGGMVSTMLLAGVVGPWLTSLRVWQAVLAGLLVAVAGIFGDLTVSACKRDVGVKDSGTLLPGQGGMLDRIDSLTFTAPAFYFLVTALP